ncbi:MAG: DegQ family serine endoprotease [Candidatus Zhuqueibacterota bacterium]
MYITKKNAFMLVMAIFVGVIAGLAISTNFDWMFRGIASDGTETVATVASKESPSAEGKISSSSASAESQDEGMDNLLLLEKAYINVAKEVKPWVVTITSEKIIRYNYRNPFDMFGNDFLDFFGNRDRRNQDREENQKNNEREFVQQGLGSGVIVSKDGYVLTNNHVVKEADEIRVMTMDKKEFQAELVGRDEKTDVAVIKIKGNDFPFARLGDSDNIQVGQIVLAIGNPFSELLQHTVTEGIISARGRSNIGLSTYEDFIQTTAAINPGNSGGALVDLKGNLIGINTAILSRSGGFNGIGLAIPINMARRVMEMIIDRGYVLRGYLGVTPQPIDEDMAQALGLESTEGALITRVEKGTPADKAGILEEDVVVEMDGKKVVNDTDFRLRVAEHNPGDRVDLKIFRDGKYRNISVKLDERPDDRPPETVTEREVTKLGISVANLTTEKARRYGYENEEGVLIVDVKQSSVAYRKGLRQGDLIVSIDKTAVTNVREYEKALNSAKPGDILLIRVKRHSGDEIFPLSIAIRLPE